MGHPAWCFWCWQEEEIARRAKMTTHGFQGLRFISRDLMAQSADRTPKRCIVVVPILSCSFDSQ